MSLGAKLGLLVVLVFTFIYLQIGLVWSLLLYLVLFVGCWLWIAYNDDDDDDDEGDGEHLQSYETPPDELPHSHWAGICFRVTGTMSVWSTFQAWGVPWYVLFGASVQYLFTGKTGKIPL